MIRARPLWVTVIGATVVLGVAVSAASPAQIVHNRSGLSRADVAGYLAELPGAPLVLPRDLRPELVWWGPTSAEHGADGLVTARTSTFTRAAMASGPTVSLCVEGRSPGATCPVGDQTVRRLLDTGDRVVIAFRGVTVSADELDWWRTVPLEHVELPDWIQ